MLANARTVLTDRGVQQPNIRLTARRGDDTIRIEVEDNGGGVDPELATTLFNPFVTSRREGTGLGLYMSRRLVSERLGGTLELTEGAAGARFVVTLPA